MDSQNTSNMSNVTKIPKRVSTALMNSLGAGVVPRIGLEYIAVGRKEESTALLQDLDNIAEGGAAFRFITGRYGSGKSFMLQLIRNKAMDLNFVVADVDLSPERRLSGTKHQGLATYRELIKNLATKTRPDGGALNIILDKWISSLQMEVSQEGNLDHESPDFQKAVEQKILEEVHHIEGLVHGFDFGMILVSYWRGYNLDNDSLRDSALRWLRGEYSTKSEAKADLNVRNIIDDSNWYDYVKLMARFVADIGYKGFLVMMDEVVNLYKISNSISRQNNYEKILTLFNDTMQGKAEHLGIFMGITPQSLEDDRRGIYSYEALRSRLVESRFVGENQIQVLGPIIRLKVLTPEEIFVLMDHLASIHAHHNGYEQKVTQVDIKHFVQDIYSKVGANQFITPREVIRDFVSILNIILQNPQLSFAQVLHQSDFQPTAPQVPQQDVEAEFADFTL